MIIERTPKEKLAYIAGLRRGGQLMADCIRLYTIREEAEECFDDLVKTVEESIAARDS